MKFSGLYISHGELGMQKFRIIEPKNFNEMLIAIKEPLPSYLDAIIYMPCQTYEVMKVDTFENVKKLSFDWVCVNERGKIISMHENLSPEQDIKLADDTFAVMIFKSGALNKNEIKIGHLIVYENFLAPL